MPSLTVEKFFSAAEKRLRLKVIAGKRGLSREITSARVQKTGLALTGKAPVDSQRVQVLGEKEMTYLSSLSAEDLEVRLRALLDSDVPCCIVTRNQDVPPLMLQMADLREVPLFRTSFDSGVFLEALAKYFLEAFSRVATVHGVLVEVCGLGILIIGASGVGKSELALDLLSRGHRFVADDVIDITLGADNSVIGSGSHLIRHHMEIRGIGIINIRDLFGVSAVRERQAIDLVVELVVWDQRREYERIGLDEKFHTLLDVPVSLLQIPVSPGRNLTTIVEVAARNHLLRQQGIHTVEDLHRRLSWAMSAEQALEEKLSGAEESEDV